MRARLHRRDLPGRVVFSGYTPKLPIPNTFYPLPAIRCTPILTAQKSPSTYP
ncbi:hypothetical protein C8R44DRAFT_758423, partial [Mycena epipterygia]